MAERSISFFDEFKDWLEYQSFENERSRKCIISRLSNLNEKFLASISTGAFKKDKKTDNDIELTIWNILESIIKNPRGPKQSYVEDFMVEIMSRVKNDRAQIAKEYNLKDRTIENYASALSTYYIFIVEKLKTLNVRTGKLTPDEEATIKNINKGKIVLTKKELIAIFTARMNTQDRCSGNKVFLPLGLIGKILSKSNKHLEFCNVRQWAKKEAERVLIHTENNCYPVSKITELTIDTTTGDVFIIIGDENHRVCNPTKAPMCIQRISQTDIDHDKEIDTILKGNGGKFEGLKFLTDLIMNSKNELGLEKIDNSNLDKIYNHIMDSIDIDDLINKNIPDKIIQDLKAISKQHALQLTDATWNRSTKKQANKNIQVYTLV